MAYLWPHHGGCCEEQVLGSRVTQRSGKPTAPETLNNKNSQDVIFFSSVLACRCLCRLSESWFQFFSNRREIPIAAAWSLPPFAFATLWAFQSDLFSFLVTSVFLAVYAQSVGIITASLKT